MNPPVAKVKFEGHVLEMSPLQLRKAAEENVPLRAKTLEVLRVLALAADHLVPKSDLIQAAWPDTFASEDSLVQCIREIRQALGPAGPRVIRTEYKRGYRLISSNGSPMSGSGINRFTQQFRHAISHDGARIAYAVSGTGPVLVRAPHWLTHLDVDWRCGTNGPLLLRLSEHFRLVRMDGRGTGASDHSVGPGMPSDWEADLAAVIDAERGRSVSLLGISTGALPVLRYAARHPERVASVVLLGPLVRGALHRGLAASHVAAQSQLIGDGWTIENPVFRQLITTTFFPEISAEDRDGFNRMQRQACNADHAAALFDQLARATVMTDLPRLKMPVLLMHSLGDQRIPFREAELAAGLIPQVRLLGLDSNNHFPLWNEPAFDDVINETIRFIEKQVARQTKRRDDRNDPRALIE